MPRRPEEETGQNPAEASPSGREAWVGGGIGVRAARAVLPPNPAPANEQARAEAKRCGVSARPRGLAQPFVGVSGWRCSLGLGRSVCQQTGAVSRLPAPPPAPTPPTPFRTEFSGALGCPSAPRPSRFPLPCPASQRWGSAGARRTHLRAGRPPRGRCPGWRCWATRPSRCT